MAIFRGVRRYRKGYAPQDIVGVNEWVLLTVVDVLYFSLPRV